MKKPKNLTFQDFLVFWKNEKPMFCKIGLDSPGYATFLDKA